MKEREPWLFLPFAAVLAAILPFRGSPSPSSAAAPKTEQAPPNPASGAEGKADLRERRAAMHRAQILLQEFMGIERDTQGRPRVTSGAPSVPPITTLIAT